MAETLNVDQFQGFPPAMPGVARVLAHLCTTECAAIGDVVEWCETRHDCAHAVVCPTCGAQFLIDDDELMELRHWAIRDQGGISCGVRLEE